MGVFLPKLCKETIWISVRSFPWSQGHLFLWFSLICTPLRIITSLKPRTRLRCHLNVFFSVLLWQTMQPTLASLRAPQYLGVSSGNKQNLLLCKRKYDHYPVAFGELRLFLICTLRDLSMKSGGRKDLLSEHSHFFSLWKPAALQDFLSPPSLPEMCPPAVLFLSSRLCAASFVGS